MKNQQNIKMMETTNDYSKALQEQVNLWNKKNNSDLHRLETCNTNLRKENSKTIIDETTIYEIDLNCYECLKNRSF